MESSDIQLARLDERMKMILERMEENQQFHASTRNWMSRINGQLVGIETRVGNVETSLAKNAPTIEEFMMIKNKVLGAGQAGRWAWITLGTVLGIIISMREYFAKLLAN